MAAAKPQRHRDPTRSSGCHRSYLRGIREKRREVELGLSALRVNHSRHQSTAIHGLSGYFDAAISHLRTADSLYRLKAFSQAAIAWFSADACELALRFKPHIRASVVLLHSKMNESASYNHVKQHGDARRPQAKRTRSSTPTSSQAFPRDGRQMPSFGRPEKFPIRFDCMKWQRTTDGRAVELPTERSSKQSGRARPNARSRIGYIRNQYPLCVSPISSKWSFSGAKSSLAEA